MKTSRLKILRGSLAAFILPLVGGNTVLQAQESMVALGNVNSVGGLLKGTTTVGGTISSTRNNTGDYTVTVAAAGAFAGSDSNDYVVEVALKSTIAGDDTIKARVTSVTDDAVVLDVHIDDVEDDSSPNAPLPTDSPFCFALQRIPQAFPAGKGTRFLLGTGRVNPAGNLLSGTGVGGITVTSVQNGAGDYNIVLSQVGGFVDDVIDDYVLTLSVNDNGDQDQVVRGAVSNVTDDGKVVFKIHSDDVQANPDDSFSTPTSVAFSFTIYRITPVEGLPASQLLVALARVDDTGTLLSAPRSFDGGTLSATQVGVGEYRVTIVSPGAFAGRAETEFVSHLHLDQAVSADEAIMSRVTIPDGNTLEVKVFTNDVEQSGDSDGVPTDTPFYLSLFDAKAVLRPDLYIGEKASLTKMKGNDVYNTTGVGQQVKFKLVSTSRKKYFFALENDGNIADHVRMNETGAGSRVRTNFYRLTGGRVNVTAKVKKLGFVEESLNPSANVLFEGRVKYLSKDKRPGRKIRLTGTSVVNPAVSDAVRLKVSGI